MKKIYNLLFFLAALIGYTSCTSEVDDVFSKPSSQRIEEAIENTESILKANTNGWIMKYYANPIYGGYNVFCKFNQDNTVTVSSELFGEEEVTSHYKLEQSQGAVLSFDEYNEIFNYFSDPANPDKIGDKGKGMEGDFEFRIQSASADEIVMLGKKNESRIVMTPMPENTTWKSYLDQISDIISKMKGKKYMLSMDGVNLEGSKSYNQLSFIDPETNANIDMPFIVTPEGYKLYMPIEYKGKTITDFTYSEDGIWKCSSDNSIALSKIVTPLVESFISNPWYINFKNVGEFATPYFNVAKNGATAIGERIYVAVFGPYTISAGSLFGLSFKSYDGASLYSGGYKFSYEFVSDDEITLEFLGTTVGDGVWYANNAGYHYMTIPFGYVNSPRTFKLSTDDMDEPSYIILTDESDETNVIRMEAFPVYFP